MDDDPIEPNDVSEQQGWFACEKIRVYASQIHSLLKLLKLRNDYETHIFPIFVAVKIGKMDEYTSSQTLIHLLEDDPWTQIQLECYLQMSTRNSINDTCV